MTAITKPLAVLLAAFALVASGCRTDDAAKKDAKDAAHDIEKGAKKAEKDAEKAIPGDSDDDGN